MKSLARVLAVLAALVLGAHVLRAGFTVLAAVLALSPLLLLLKRRWASPCLQVVLALGAVEWLRTLAILVSARRAQGMPYARLALILGVVLLVTASASVLLALEARRRAAAGPEAGRPPAVAS